MHHHTQAQQEATIHGYQLHIVSHNDAQKIQTERIQVDLEESFANSRHVDPGL
jgi:hypothetical protein